MTALSEKQRAVETEDSGMVDRFIKQHRSVCGKPLPMAMHLDQRSAFADFYECECGASASIEFARYGKNLYAVLVASQAMADAATTERKEGTPA